MFNGTAVRVCSARRADCERGLLLLGAADAVEQPTSLIADLAEQNLVHAERFGAMTTVAWTGGAGYCWKMAYACTRGNQNACDMYDRHCEPAE